MSGNFDRVSDCLHTPDSLKAVQEHMSETKHKICAMLAGNIIGDMLGTTLVSEQADNSGEIFHTDITGGGPFSLSAGDWTDDTSMMLALCESIYKCGGVEPKAEYAEYLKWLNDGKYTPGGKAFDIGRTTRAALTTGRACTTRSDNGNGALMRSCPVSAAYINKTIDIMDEASAASCAVTHGHPIAKFCNVIYNRILRDCILGLDLKDSLVKVREMFEGLMEDIDPIFEKPEKFGSTGYCVTTLQTAVWITIESGSFEEALLKAVHLRGDADTVGAVTGAVAGAVFGIENIPDRWLEFVKDERIMKYQGIKSLLSDCL